jgi:hypothetical protein
MVSALYAPKEVSQQRRRNSKRMRSDDLLVRGQIKIRKGEVARYQQ